MENMNERKTYETKFVFLDGVITTFIHDAETGRVNHTISTDGTEEFFTYADDGHLISAQILNSEGCELYEYDENQNCIHYKNTKRMGREVWIDRDDRGRITHKKVVNHKGEVIDTWFEYDDGICKCRDSLGNSGYGIPAL